MKILQRELSEAGIKTKPTARFDRTTRAHVKEFQREHRLSADGVVGSNTARKLNQVVKALVHAAKTKGSGKSGSGGGSSGSGTTKTTASTTSTSCTTTTPGSGQDGLVLPPAVCLHVQKLHLTNSGLVVVPDNAPAPITKLLTAANKIAHRLYVYGGGHNGWGKQPGYDCSGSTSYVLHAAGMMVKDQGDRWDEPFDSTQFERYGVKGKSQSGWITLYANGGHVYMKISNLYFDTAAQGGKRHGTRWSTSRVSPAHPFTVRHPKGW